MRAVASFASCTFGWSKGLMPQHVARDGGGELPAEELRRRAAAGRRRAAARPDGRRLLERGSGPRGRRWRRRGGRRRRPRAARAARPRPGRCPCPPCRSTRRSAARPSSRSVAIAWRQHERQLVAAGDARASPSDGAQPARPGSPRPARCGGRRAASRAPRSRSWSRSTPMSAAGTSPKYDSAE